jgi:hypothetical protein
MATKKISALPVLTTPTTDDVLPVVNAGVTQQLSVANLATILAAPAGSLTGTTLNATVVTSSLTALGTIGTGVWQGTAVAAGYGGTGQLGGYAVGDILYASAAAVLSKLAKGTSGYVLTMGASLPAWAAPAAAAAGSLTGTTLNATVVTSSLTSVGALNAGSITSGFGAIDIGTDGILAGTVTFAGTITTNNGTIKLVTAAGSSRLIYIYSSAAARWAVGANGGAESGGNAGSDYVLYAYDDAGSYLGNPVSITRAGAVSFAGNVGIGNTAPTHPLIVGTSAQTNDLYLFSLKLQGYGVSDGTHGYGMYGGCLFNADSTYTSTARRIVITNALGTNKFAIIRSTNSTTDPTLGTAGAVTSGTADLVIDNTGLVGLGTVTPTAKLQVVGLVDYANNAAAAAAGLSAGAFYTETGTNPKKVCVVY